MKNSPVKQHWERIYKTKDTTSEVSWYQDNPRTSIDLILSTGVHKDGNIIDIGGGDSKLVDKLIELSFKNLFVFFLRKKQLFQSYGSPTCGWGRGRGGRPAGCR